MKKLTKKQWYDLGGFRNPSLFRKGTPNGWSYWQDADHPSASKNYQPSNARSNPSRD